MNTSDASTVELFETVGGVTPGDPAGRDPTGVWRERYVHLIDSGDTTGDVTLQVTPSSEPRSAATGLRISVWSCTQPYTTRGATGVAYTCPGVETMLVGDQPAADTPSVRVLTADQSEAHIRFRLQLPADTPAGTQPIVTYRFDTQKPASTTTPAG